MGEVLPIVHLARHGETAWTLSGQHTGLTDPPLTQRGEGETRRLAERLRGVTFAKVWTSPLQRATRTCVLATNRFKGGRHVPASRHRPDLCAEQRTERRQHPAASDERQRAADQGARRRLAGRRFAEPRRGLA
jgi:broad specificity phosphatase PhoE